MIARMRGDRTQDAQPLRDLETLRSFLTGNAMFAFFDAPWTPMFIVVIFLLHPWLGLFALASALLLFALAYVNERATGPMLDEAAKLAAETGFPVVLKVVSR